MLVVVVVREGGINIFILYGNGDDSLPTQSVLALSGVKLDYVPARGDRGQTRQNWEAEMQ